jgi:hypothetical protein
MRNVFIIALFIGYGLVNAQEFKSDAVFEKITKEYTLHGDGSIEFHYYKKLKLNSHYSMNRLYGETFIVYNPNNEALKINKAETTQVDGKVVKSPENAFNEVLPRAANNAPFYNHLREMVVTHTGLEVGATIELDYTLTSHADYYPGLMANELITESSPITEQEIIIRIPKGMELNYKVFNIRTGPQIIESDDSRIYVFKFTGIKENSHEYNQPDHNTHLPRLIFSTMNQEKAIQYLAEQTAFEFKCNQQMQSAISKMKTENQDDLPLILAIQKLVTDNINTYNVPGEYNGFKLREPIKVWESNGGTPIEKTVLLVALLREAGIHAEAVAVMPTQFSDKSIGCISAFHEYLVQVNPKEKEQMYISATQSTSQNMVYSLDGNTTLVLSANKFFSDPISELFENQVITKGAFILDDSMKITGNIEMLLTEKLNPYYKLNADYTSVKSLIGGGLSSADMSSTDIINTAQYRSLVKMKIETKAPIKNHANYYFWELPMNKQGTQNWHLSYLNSERIADFKLPEVINEQYSYEITLPANTELLNPVALTEIKKDFGELVVSTVQEGDKVTVKRMLKITRKEISTLQYKDFKQMYDLWNDKGQWELALKVSEE